MTKIEIDLQYIFGVMILVCLFDIYTLSSHKIIIFLFLLWRSFDFLYYLILSLILLLLGSYQNCTSKNVVFWLFLLFRWAIGLFIANFLLFFQTLFFLFLFFIPNLFIFSIFFNNFKFFFYTLNVFPLKLLIK